MIKAVIFDWGGVLIHYPSDKLMEFCADFFGVDTDRFAEAYAKHETGFMKGEISEKDLWKMVSGELGVPEPNIGSLWRQAVEAVFADNEEVYDIVRALRGNGYKTGFLSNTELPTSEYFKEKGYEKYFDATVFSCLEGTVKPEEKIYHIALKRLGVAPEETVFVDDAAENVEAADKLGMHGVEFKDAEQLRTELELLGADLSENI